MFMHQSAFGTVDFGMNFIFDENCVFTVFAFIFHLIPIFRFYILWQIADIVLCQFLIAEEKFGDENLLSPYFIEWKNKKK